MSECPECGLGPSGWRITGWLAAAGYFEAHYFCKRCAHSWARELEWRAY